MSELEQWCEIDGHEWATHYLEYGLVLGPKIFNISKICIKCRLEEQTQLGPYSEYPKSMYLASNFI